MIVEIIFLNFALSLIFFIEVDGEILEMMSLVRLNKLQSSWPYIARPAWTEIETFIGPSVFWIDTLLLLNKFVTTLI